MADEVTKADRDYAMSAVAMLERRERDALAIANGADEFGRRNLAHRLLHAFLFYRDERYGLADDMLDAVVADQAFVDAYPSVLYYAGRTRIYHGSYREGLKLLMRFDDLKQAPRGSAKADP